MNLAAETPPPVSEPPRSLSLLGRAVAVFARPAEAWEGLESRSQWWFPVLLFLGLMAVGVLAVHDRAIVPTMLETFDRQVADGQMGAEQAAAAERFMTGTLGRTLVAAQQTVVIFLAFLVSAGALAFAVGFLLGGKLRFRLALEVTGWSALVTLPGQMLFFVLAWVRETMQGVHVGLGAFVPEPETPSRLLRGLTVFLDFLGPFSIWALVVTILGASALSGLPRKRVAWTVASVNVALWLCFAALAALFSPGA